MTNSGLTGKKDVLVGGTKPVMEGLRHGKLFRMKRKQRFVERVHALEELFFNMFNTKLKNNSSDKTL